MQNKMEINDIEQKLEVATLSDPKSNKATVLRGRLIREIKKGIKAIKQDKEMTEQKKENLAQLEEKLVKQLSIHKSQLKSKYKTEFLEKKANLLSLVTVLPKGVSLSVREVVACINELKIAKKNEDKIKKFGELMVAEGKAFATPMIYATKFAVTNWYLAIAAISAKLIKDLGKNLKNGLNYKTIVHNIGEIKLFIDDPITYIKNKLFNKNQLDSPTVAMGGTTINESGFSHHSGRF